MEKFTYLMGCLMVILFFQASLTSAQTGSLPEAGFGAHGLSLGRSAIASPHDALSNSWNPASMTRLEKITITAFYSRLLSDALSSNVGIVMPTYRYGYFGVSFFQTRIKEINIRNISGQKSGEYLSYKNNHLLFIYGRNFSNAVAAGFSLKFVAQNFFGHSSTLENPGVDFGFLYYFKSSHQLLRKLSVGIAVDNLVKPTLKLAEKRETLPYEVRFMTEKELRVGDGKLTLLSNLSFLKAFLLQDSFQTLGASSIRINQ